MQYCMARVDSEMQYCIPLVVGLSCGRELQGADRPLIRDWYDLQPPDVRAQFDDRVDFLTGEKSWKEIGEIEELEREEAGLWGFE